MIFCNNERNIFFMILMNFGTMVRGIASRLLESGGGVVAGTQQLLSKKQVEGFYPNPSISNINYKNRFRECRMQFLQVPTVW